MNQDIQDYNNSSTGDEIVICNTLAELICLHLPEAENKIWHAHPVWFLEGNPVVGYSRRKKGICLLFWSGQLFNEPLLENEGSFKAAQIFYNSAWEINPADIEVWLEKARNIQWDYKNIVKRKGKLERLK